MISAYVKRVFLGLALIFSLTSVNAQFSVYGAGTPGVDGCYQPVPPWTNCQGQDLYGWFDATTGTQYYMYKGACWYIATVSCMPDSLDILYQDCTGNPSPCVSCWTAVTGAEPAPFVADTLDFDQDGYTVCDGDCDDGNNQVNPGATEILCDGLDNDCNVGTPDDNQPPTAVCQNITLYLDATGNASIIGGDVNGGSTDNCSALTYSVDISSFTCADLGANTVTMTAYDISQNSASCMATVTVVDTVGPMISGCPSDTTIVANDTGCTAIYTWTPPSESDVCYSSTMVSTHNSGDNFPFGTTTVEYTATDSANNTSTCSFDITVVSSLDISVDSIDHVSCAGGSDGSVDLLLSAGALPMMYDWDNDGTGDNDDSQDQTGLAPGPYNVVATDANGCTTNLAVTITEPSPLSISANVTHETSGNDGAIDITVSGGTPNYSYDWNIDGIGDFDDGEDLAGIASGTYTVWVMDANGCIDSLVVVVDPPVGVNEVQGLKFSVWPNPSDGQVQLNIAGTESNYQLEIYSADGRLVERQLCVNGRNELMLDADGTYMLHLISSKGTLVKPVIVTK